MNHPNNPGSSDKASAGSPQVLLDYSQLDERINRLRSQLFQLLVIFDSPAMSSLGVRIRESLARIREELYEDIMPSERFEHVQTVAEVRPPAYSLKRDPQPEAWTPAVGGPDTCGEQSEVTSFTPLHPALSRFLAQYAQVDLPEQASDSRLQASGGTVLNVGSGAGSTVPSLWSDWRQVRLDGDPTVNPDILWNLEESNIYGLPQDVKFNAAFMSHALEHLPFGAGMRTLKGLFDRLEPGGVLCVVVPNIRIAARFIADGLEADALYQTSAFGGITPVDILYGLHEQPSGEAISPFMHHRYGYTEKTLKQMFMRLGFPCFSTWAIEGEPTDVDKTTVGWLEVWGVVKKGLEA